MVLDVEKRRARRGWLVMLAFVVLGGVAVLFLLRRPVDTDSEIASAGYSRTPIPPVVRLHVDEPHVDAEPDAEAIDAIDPASVPEGSILVHRASLDDLRREQGLPPISPALIEMNNFRRPTRKEMENPESRAMYELDYQIHRASLLAEHNQHEYERFLRQAREEPSPQIKQDLLESATARENTARALLERAEQLRQEREELRRHSRNRRREDAE
ncbi:MAG: hypothetical protein V2A73_01215 [Pseudomonadota bacterium]